MSPTYQNTWLATFDRCFEATCDGMQSLGYLLRGVVTAVRAGSHS